LKRWGKHCLKAETIIWLNHSGGKDELNHRSVVICKGGNYILKINTVLFQTLNTQNLWQIRGTPPPILVAQERSSASQGGVNKSDRTNRRRMFAGRKNSLIL